MGVADDGPAHRHALPLATGEFTRIAREQVGKPRGCGNLKRGLLGLGLGDAADAQAVGQVFPDRQRRGG